MATLEDVKSVLGDTLQLGERAATFDAATPLFGTLPELDSMAVVALITALEERFELVVEDEEITAAVFETVGSLTDFVDSKLAS